MEPAAGFENGVGGDPYKATSWRGAQAFPKLEPFSYACARFGDQITYQRRVGRGCS